MTKDTKPTEGSKSAVNGVVMPASLTAANGAKALLSGKFFEEFRISCPYCGREFADNGFSDCEECNSSGEYIIKIPISWTNIKAIYLKAVNFFSEA